MDGEDLLPACGLRYRDELCPTALTAGAELVADAIGEIAPGSAILEVGGGAGALTETLVEIAERQAAVLTVIDESRDLLALGPRAPLRVCVVGPALPFDDASFDVAASNLVLGRRLDDPAGLREIRRVLKPLGQLTASMLLEGSFEEVTDLVLEVAERDELRDVARALREARLRGVDVGTASAQLAEAGFEVAASGIVEQGLSFHSGAHAVRSPLFRGAFALALRLAPIDAPPALGAKTLDGIAEAIDRYFEGGTFAITTRIAVVTAEQTGKDLEFQAVTG